MVCADCIFTFVCSQINFLNTKLINPRTQISESIWSICWHGMAARPRSTPTDRHFITLRFFHLLAGFRYLSSVLFFAPRSRIETDPFCLKVVNNKLSPRCYFRDFISPQFYPKGFEELRFPGVPQAVRPSSRNFSGKAECRDHNLMKRIKLFWGTIESDLTLWKERLYLGRPPAL